jgi:hypothetical protein
MAFCGFPAKQRTWTRTVLSPVNSPLPLHAADAATNFVAITQGTDVAATPSNTEINSPSSVVALSIQAQNLLAGNAANDNSAAGLNLAPTLTAATATPPTTTNSTLTANAINLTSDTAANATPPVLSTVAAANENPLAATLNPAVAAAIAAYRVGDGLLSEKETLTEEAPPEGDLDVAPAARIEGVELNPDDEARDNALHSSNWSWTRVYPIRKRFTWR